MGITQDGIDGEQKLFKWLANHDRRFFQIDAMSFEDGAWIVNEVKCQEYFKAGFGCDFDGHGLSQKQIDARMWFWELTGYRCRFIVFEKGTDEVYWQWLDVLEKSKYYDTQGSDPEKRRRIYPLTAFNKE